MKNITKIHIIALMLAALALLCGCELSLPELLAPSEPSYASSEDGAASQQSPVEPQPMGKTKLTMYVIDVGQGQAVLLTTDSMAILVDAGEYSAADSVLALLHELGIERLDAAINTHPHYDHYGGMRKVLRSVPADAFYTTEIPDGLYPTEQAYADLMADLAAASVPVEMLREGDSIDMGEAQLTGVGPINTYGTVNDISLALRAVCGDTAFLLCGDMGFYPEQDLVLAGVELSADVLLVGHHGSSGSANQKFLRAVGARYAAISVGADNMYGLPGEATLRRLADEGIIAYQTDINGRITYTSDGSSVAVQTER